MDVIVACPSGLPGMSNFEPVLDVERSSLVRHLRLHTKQVKVHVIR